MSLLPVVNVYIDGYNFYGFINKPETLRLGWCNFLTLAHRLSTKAFPKGYSLGAVKYYTSRVPKDLQYLTDETLRQRLWLDALRWGTNFGVTVVEGYYQKDDQKRRVEKKTDTNLAIAIVRDALTISAVEAPSSAQGRDRASRFDAAILVSADRDFDPAVEMVANEYGKDVAVFLPMEEESSRISNGRIQIHKLTYEDLKQSRLPDVIERPGAAERISWWEYEQLRNSAKRYRQQLRPVPVDVDLRNFERCQQLGKRSPDLNTQVGCVVVGPDRQIRSEGWNTFPKGIAKRPNRLIAPAKYTWIEHAERNAIYHASRIGRSLEDCTIYIELVPCVNCARAIIQSGIREVVVRADRVDSYVGEHYLEQQVLAREMLKEAGVGFRQFSLASSP
jgi:dCMP deaminase